MLQSTSYFSQSPFVLDSIYWQQPLWIRTYYIFASKRKRLTNRFTS